MLRHLPAFKVPVWAMVGLTLALGWRHARDEYSIVLLVLAAIDVMSAVWIAVDRRRGEAWGDPTREIANQIKGDVEGELVGAVLKRAGVPESIVDGSQASKDAREGPPDLGLGSRVFFNHVWSVLLLYGCYYVLRYGWQ